MTAPEDGRTRPLVVEGRLTPSHVAAVQFAVMMVVREELPDLSEVEDVRLALDEVVFGVHSRHDVPVRVVVAATSGEIRIDLRIGTQFLTLDEGVVAALVDELVIERGQEHVDVRLVRRHHA